MSTDIKEITNTVKPVDKRLISKRLISNVLLSTASLLEVTGWTNAIAMDIHGVQDLSRALWQVVHGSYDSREGLWHASRDALLNEIGGRCTCLAKWNDKQKDASVVIALCRRAAEKQMLLQKPSGQISIEIL